MKTINIVGALMLVILITSIPLSHTVIAASSPQLTVYTYNILEVPVDVGGLVFKGSLKMFNDTVRIYIEGSLDSNHTLEGFIDLKFKRVYENRTFKANLTLNAAIANVSSRDLNFTLNADIYWEAFESEGRLVSYSVIAANYTLFGALPESLMLKSLRIESTSTLVFLIAENVSRLTVESILKPRSGMPEVDRMLTLMLATIINETLRNVKADLEKIPGVTFEYKIEVEPREAQLNIRINLLCERGLPREVFKILAPGIVEKEGYANIKLKPGTVEFKLL